MDSELYKAREEALSAACGLIGSRLYIHVQSGGAWDDAEIEMREDMFDEAVKNYANLLQCDQKG